MFLLLISNWNLAQASESDIPFTDDEFWSALSFPDGDPFGRDSASPYLHPSDSPSMVPTFAVTESVGFAGAWNTREDEKQVQIRDGKTASQFGGGTSLASDEQLSYADMEDVYNPSWEELEPTLAMDQNSLEPACLGSTIRVYFEGLESADMMKEPKTSPLPSHPKQDADLLTRIWNWLKQFRDEETTNTSASSDSATGRTMKQRPSEVPTATPVSFHPTSEPTKNGTSQKPTGVPVSIRPTSEPTYRTTLKPTFQPSLRQATLKPSRKPIHKPLHKSPHKTSHKASHKPAHKPTSQPASKRYSREVSPAALVSAEKNTRMSLLIRKAFRQSIVETGMFIHTPTHSAVRRRNFGSMTRWYQEDGNTQIFRMFPGEDNMRSARRNAPRVEAYSLTKWKRGDGWHEFSAVYTFIKSRNGAVFQIKHNSKYWSIQLVLAKRENGQLDLMFNHLREPELRKVLAADVEGKSVHVRVLDNGTRHQVYINDELMVDGEMAERGDNEMNHFRWGLYSPTKSMDQDILILVTGAHVAKQQMLSS